MVSDTSNCSQSVGKIPKFSEKMKRERRKEHKQAENQTSVDEIEAAPVEDDSQFLPFKTFTSPKNTAVFVK